MEGVDVWWRLVANGMRHGVLYSMKRTQKETLGGSRIQISCFWLWKNSDGSVLPQAN